LFMAKYFISILLMLSMSSCTLFHRDEPFEMERLSEDVLSSKTNKGISITILPVDPSK
jgi:hypothetical protein